MRIIINKQNNDKFEFKKVFTSIRDHGRSVLVAIPARQQDQVT